MIITDKTLKLGLFIVSSLLVFNTATNFFKPDKNLQELRSILDSAQVKIDQSILQVNSAKTKINDIDTTLNNFRMQLFYSRQRADELDSLTNKREKEFRVKTTASLNEIKSLQSGIELSNNDLPEIPTEILAPDQK